MGRVLARRAILVIATVVLTVISVPIGASGQATQNARASPGIAMTSGSNGISANATWNGVDVASAHTSGSAFSWSSSASVDVRFHWLTTGGAAPLSVATARLEVFFLGFGVVTRDVNQPNPVPATNGTFDLAWAGSGILGYLIEGDYQITASLLNPNGSTLWHQDFFVRMVALYDVAAVTPIILLAVAVLEIVEIARAGASSAKSPPKSARPTKATPPSEAPAEGTAEEATTSEGGPTK